VIYELIERFRKETFITNETVREVRHYGSIKEIDLTIIVVLILGGISILRYLSLETGEDSMKFFGGAALVSLLVFRNLFRGSKRPARLPYN